MVPAERDGCAAPAANRADHALYLLPLDLAMGMPYPLGLRAVGGKDPGEIPWVWSVNAAASVLGSILAFVVAMAAGFRWVLLLAALWYLGALASAKALRTPD